MQITSYRLVEDKHSRTAFDGEGARLFGGRWNSKGTPVVYTSDSLALCCLEILVHLPSYDFLKTYVYMKVLFDSKLVSDAKVVDGWDARPVSRISQSIGDKWVKEGTSAVLRVPSVIVPDGDNFLINFSHPDANRIKISDPISLDVDPRFKK